MRKKRHEIQCFGHNPRPSLNLNMYAHKGQSTVWRSHIYTWEREQHTPCRHWLQVSFRPLHHSRIKRFLRRSLVWQMKLPCSHLAYQFSQLSLTIAIIHNSQLDCGIVTVWERATGYTTAILVLRRVEITKVMTTFLSGIRSFATFLTSLRNTSFIFSPNSSKNTCLIGLGNGYQMLDFNECRSVGTVMWKVNAKKHWRQETLEIKSMEQARAVLF